MRKPYLTHSKDDKLADITRDHTVTASSKINKIQRNDRSRLKLGHFYFLESKITNCSNSPIKPESCLFFLVAMKREQEVRSGSVSIWSLTSASGMTICLLRTSEDIE